MPCRWRTVQQIVLCAVFCLCSARSTIAQVGVRPSDPETGTPAYDKAFSSALTTLLEHASDGFVSERQTKKNFPVGSTTLWESGIRFPGGADNCSVWVGVGTLPPYMTCSLTSFFIDTQKAKLVFEGAVNTLVRVLPPSWVVVANEIEQLTQASTNRGLRFHDAADQAQSADHQAQSISLNFDSTRNSVDMTLSLAPFCRTCEVRTIAELRTLPPLSTTPKPEPTLSESLGLILGGADNGFAPLRKKLVRNQTKQWDTGIRLPGSYQNCTVQEFKTADVLCWLTNPSSSDKQKARTSFEELCRTLFQSLPPDWTLDARDLEKIFLVRSAPPGVPCFGTTCDLVQVEFRAPDRDGISISLLFNPNEATFTLTANSERGCDPCSGRALSKLRPLSGEELRETASVEEAGFLRAEMFNFLDRCKAVIDQYDALGVGSSDVRCVAQISGADIRDDKTAAEALYKAGRYDEALVRIISLIQSGRQSQIYMYGGYEFELRGLIEAALGQLGPALQDFERAKMLHNGDPWANSLLSFKRAIVLYLFGAQAEGQKSCAEYLAFRTNDDYSKGFCERMATVGTRITMRPGLAEANGAKANKSVANVITLENPSALDAVVKVVGPSPLGLSLHKGKSCRSM